MRIYTVAKFQMITDKKALYVAKKGSKYITIANGSLCTTTIQADALAAENPKLIEKMVDMKCKDDAKSAKVIGRKYDVVTLIVR
jgi:hypothetical protein